ncbi:MAG: CDP-alcohol phosphatidyltransferase family protein, partial [Klebsiella pneumoniae]|nr:CDP-alcohol phosphatidyltransferase family protein [Klebsiella pneumoniae]
MQFNIPTLLTLFRVILIPFFVLAFYLPFSWAPFACALIFFVAAVTDWFDGF